MISAAQLGLAELLAELLAEIGFVDLALAAPLAEGVQASWLHTMDARMETSSGVQYGAPTVSPGNPSAVTVAKYLARCT
jgi:hypothetical protein